MGGGRERRRRAIVALRNTEHDLQAISLGRDMGHLPDPPPVKDLTVELLPLGESVQKYLAEVRRFRSGKTIAACENMLGRFSSYLPGKLLKDITREDLLNYMFSLKESGLGDRTIHNHMSRVGSFLKAGGVTGLLKTSDKPTYDEKDVSACDSEELTWLFAVTKPDDRPISNSFWVPVSGSRR